MGRGLSDLQKNILMMAYDNHVKNKTTPPVKDEAGQYSDCQGSDLDEFKILFELFGFKDYVKYHGQRGGERIVFDMGAIGKERYNSARASLSRALKRLEERGLILRWVHHYGELLPGLASEVVHNLTTKKRALTEEEIGLLGNLMDGLFVRYKLIHGLRLTIRGVEAAKELTVKTSEQYKKVLTDRT